MKKWIDLETLRENSRRIDWPLLCFLIGMLNVKLVVKVITLLVIVIAKRKTFSWRSLAGQPHLIFYLSMIVISLTNLLLHRERSLSYGMVLLLGNASWLMAAAASYGVMMLIRSSDPGKMHRTLTVFFLWHIAVIACSLLYIMIDAGSFNPYTFKGLNQKYYISTGDYIRGIGLDDAVTTALTAAFGVLYFMGRQRYLYAFLSMLAVLAIFSNLTNIFLLLILLAMFVFRSNRAQKSMVIVFVCCSVVSITTVSPQNNEYVVSFLYKMIGKAYYLPPVKVITQEELRHMPDSALSPDQRREKTALRYIDSLSAVANAGAEPGAPLPADTPRMQERSIEYRATEQVRAKESRFATFLRTHFSAGERDSIQRQFPWDKPGKLIAGLQLRRFLQLHPDLIVLGAGTGNFSSRIAFKATALGIFGSYPSSYAYVSPFFLPNHLYVYLYYHSQWQINHTAANTPDSTYYQLAGEYGMIGLLLFCALYVAPFLIRSWRSVYALPSLALLLFALSIGYWFEQLSITLLFECLFFLDLKSKPGEGQVS